MDGMFLNNGYIAYLLYPFRPHPILHFSHSLPPLRNPQNIAFVRAIRIYIPSIFDCSHFKSMSTKIAAITDSTFLQRLSTIFYEPGCRHFLPFTKSNHETRFISSLNAGQRITGQKKKTLHKISLNSSSIWTFETP